MKGVVLAALMLSLSTIYASDCNNDQYEACRDACTVYGQGPGLITSFACSRQMVVATGEDYTNCTCTYSYDPDFEPERADETNWCLVYPDDPECWTEPIWVQMPSGTMVTNVTIIQPQIAPEP